MLAGAGMKLSRRGVQAENIQQGTVRIRSPADAGHSLDVCTPASFQPPQNSVQLWQKAPTSVSCQAPEGGTPLVLQPSHPREGRRGDNTVGLSADANCRDGTTATDVATKEPTQFIHP